MMMIFRSLRRAVHKLRFVMIFQKLRFIGFKNELPSERGLVDVVFSNKHANNVVYSDHDTSTPAAERGITRTISNTWSAINRSLSGSFSPKPISLSSKSSTTEVSADVDKRADHFIANFYKRLQLEKQISLELRHASSSSRTIISDLS